MKRKVVIIGGGFAGALIANKLERKFQVTLIDTKDYFEFTPSVLRTIVEPEHIKQIQVLHRHYLKRAKIIIGEAKKLTKTSVRVRLVNNSEKKLNFDYLVIASGSSYNLPIKEQNLVISTRAHHLRDSYEKLCNAKRVLLIGGGVVGTELAAEIAEHYSDKKIILVHAKNRLIERNPKKASKYAEKFLKKRGVEIIFNERVENSKKGVFLTDKKTKIKADVAFLCTGITPNSGFLKKGFSSSLDKRNYIKVNSFLQVKRKGKKNKIFKNIFAAGDITSIKEEKLAQTAEKQARIIVKNICGMEAKEKLCKYKSQRRIMVISLGKRNGILVYKNFILKGVIPGILKSLIEKEKMMRYQYDF